MAASTASGHLARLVGAGWLEVESHGRHRYYRLANEEIGEVLEGVARLAPAQPVRSLSADLRRRQLRRARTCYGHLAGRLGVELLAGMLRSTGASSATIWPAPWGPGSPTACWNSVGCAGCPPAGH